jgi:hypothetical protein
MSQEETPRFSHIAVGTSAVSDGEQPENEEIITIGAVDQTPDSVVLDQGSLQEQPIPFEQSATAQTPSGEHISPEDDIDGLAVPMPLPQRIVLIACLVGVVVAIVFIVNYWL